MEWKGTTYYIDKEGFDRVRNGYYGGDSENYNYTSSTNINFNFPTEISEQYKLEIEKQKKEIELMDSKIQQNRFNTLRDCIRLGMSNKEISKMTGFAETQIDNYRMSFK